MSNKKRIYTIATSHLDTVWSWDLEETINEYIYATLVENFRMFEKYPNYTFSFEGAYRYELMEEYYPELFNKMTEYIKEGRWNVCGSAYENGDVNIPSPEALFRNILIGNSYFRNKFGKTSCDIYLPDCFGFGWALPSIMNHANLKGFTTQKLSWGSAYGIPFDTGRWRGPDGKEVFSTLKLGSYTAKLKQLRGWDFIEEKLKENEKYDFDWTAAFHGTGDRGGAPKEKSIAFVDRGVEECKGTDTQVIAGAADLLYRDMDTELSPEAKAKLPLWENELVMTDHAVGGYTSRVMSKRWNRRAEELADMAERASVFSDWTGAYSYNKDALTRSWKRVISHQFHDDMPGTSCQRVYKRSWNDLYVSMNQFERELNGAGTRIASLMDTSSCQGYAVTVFNPIEADRHQTVTAVLDGIKTDSARVFCGAEEVKSQCTRLSDGKMQIIFMADVKSMGARVYDIRESNTPCTLKSNISVTNNTLENEKYIVTLNHNGDISSIIDKTLDNKELLKAPITTGIFNYTGAKSYPAWEMRYKEAAKSPDRIPSLVKSEILENGPARVSVKVTQKDDRSTFTTVISLTDGGETVDISSETEWQSLCSMAKNIFSFTAENEKATFDLGLGAIERGNMTEALYEVPAQKWADITDKGGEYGVSVISECKYGWDKFDNNTLRLTIVHTPKENYRIDTMQSMMDLGLIRHSFAIYSHKNGVGADTQLQAREFIQPMCAFLSGKHRGEAGTDYSFGSVSSQNVIIRAIKKAEDTEEIIVRLGEGAKTPVENFALTLCNGIESAREVYASEEHKGEATVIDGRLVTSFAPYEIKTFALTLKKCGFDSVKPVSEQVIPTPDKQLITSQGHIGDFTYTAPAEITPDCFSAGGISYSISKSKYNAILSNGQTITLEKGTDKLVLLCASLKGDKTAEFKVNGTSVKKTVCNIFERPARWDMYDFKETARIKDCRVALELTHCHKDFDDATAKSMYFFEVDIDLNGSESVILPKDKDILILSAVALTGETDGLVTPLCEKVENRKFTFTMTRKEKKQYKKARKKKNLSDKKFYNRKNWGKYY